MNDFIMKVKEGTIINKHPMFELAGMYGKTGEARR
jgi:hypothetical protein